MMRSVLVLAVSTALLAGHAYAQSDALRVESERLIARVCLTTPAVQGVAPDEAQSVCQCVAEVTAAQGNERELTFFSRVFAHYPDMQAASAEMARMMRDEGYTEADQQAVSDMLSRATQAARTQCA